MHAISISKTHSTSLHKATRYRMLVSRPQWQTRAGGYYYAHCYLRSGAASFTSAREEERSRLIEFQLTSVGAGHVYSTQYIHVIYAAFSVPRYSKRDLSSRAYIHRV